MNINIQKIVKYATSAAAVCAILLSSLVVPSYAAVAAYDPDDFVESVVVDGDMKTVTFVFDGLTPLTNVYENPGAVKSQFSGDQVTYRATLEETTNVSFRVFPLGVETWDSKPPNPGASIDVSDIMPGADLALSMVFKYKISHVSMLGTDETENMGVSLKISCNFGFYYYDKDGVYLGTEWGSSTNHTFTPSESGMLEYSDTLEWTFAPDVAYVCPFYALGGTDANFIREWLFTVYPADFSMSTDVNMIYENSVTMDRIEEELGDISSGIDDVNDKLDDVANGISGTNDRLDDTNEKLDDIISGGQAAEDVKPDNDKLTGSTNDLDDANNAMDDAMANIPTAPTDLGSLIDDEVLDKALTNGEKVFDWEASGLSRMFPPLGLSCGLSVLFYTIFGKKG